ncbi:MAG: hypothetical protein NTV49_05890 [Kiritimatiellaeota bacterium]|nr:hypothetical protein [Kiritimatiellota bacterium]
MEPTRAKEIVKALADGRDPATGEPFPPDSPYQQADTVRALYLALEALERGGRPARTGDAAPRAARPIDPNRPKVGAAWTPEEEQRLRDAFAEFKRSTENSSSVATAVSESEWRRRIAADHGRYPGAITARLVKLGLIEDNPTNRSGRGHRPPNPSGSPIRPIGPNRPIPSGPAPAADTDAAIPF